MITIKLPQSDLYVSEIHEDFTFEINTNPMNFETREEAQGVYDILTTCPAISKDCLTVTEEI